jgi:hypothetical protein
MATQAILKPRIWTIRTSTVRLLTTAVLAEILPTWCLWVTSPTDSIRVWYPSFWSYLGEHFLPWCVILWIMLSLLKPFREQAGLQVPNHSRVEPIVLKIREVLPFAGILVTAEVVATSFVIGWNSLGHGTLSTRMFYTRSVSDYLSFREPIFLVVLAVAGGALNRLVHNRYDGTAFEPLGSDQI